jgi:catechol 2,3-dioxygenase-like lactoylglutathione lyase family enzyme
MAFRITGLDHIVLVCRDVEASLAFYCDQLGLEPERVDLWRDRKVPFPSVRITPTTIIDLFGGDPGTGRNLDHVCLTFEGDTLEALQARFPDGRRGDDLFGAQGLANSLYIQDPDGNTIELRAYDVTQNLSSGGRA